MRAALAALLVLALVGCDSRGIQTGDAHTDHGVPSGDEDGDGISDAEEGREEGVDTDGDGIPDYLDEDSDGDTIPDSLESGDMDPETPAVDTDGDGTPDFRDLDSDDNGILDIDEGAEDLDGDTIPDHVDPDNDGDYLDDDVEIGDPSDPTDFDGDGIPDYDDVDSDGDTIGDKVERDLDTDWDGMTDRHDLDSDEDGIPDADEAGDADLDTMPIDTDGDFVPDFRDLDSDNDGLSDSYEHHNGLDPFNVDSDDDGTLDPVELSIGTDPTNPDENHWTAGHAQFSVPYDEREEFTPSPIEEHFVYTPSSTEATTLTTEAFDDFDDGVDAIEAFLERIDPDTVGGIEDPMHPGRFCVGGLAVEDLEPPLDGEPDTFSSVEPGTPVCFTVRPRANCTVPATHEIQVFYAAVEIRGTAGSPLEYRGLIFVVPPSFELWP